MYDNDEFKKVLFRLFIRFIPFFVIGVFLVKDMTSIEILGWMIKCTLGLGILICVLGVIVFLFDD